MVPFLLEGFWPPEVVQLPCPSFVAPPCVPEKGEWNTDGLFVEYCWIVGVTWDLGLLEAESDVEMVIPPAGLVERGVSLTIGWMLLWEDLVRVTCMGVMKLDWALSPDSFCERWEDLFCDVWAKHGAWMVLGVICGDERVWGRDWNDTIVCMLLLALLLLLLLFPRLDIGEESAVFVPGDAVGAGRGLDGNDVTSRLTFVALIFLWVFNAEFLFIACDGALVTPALSTLVGGRREDTKEEERDTIAVEDKEVDPDTETEWGIVELEALIMFGWRSGEAKTAEGLLTDLGSSGETGLSPWARPLAVLPRMARAWEIESRDGAIRSSLRESRHLDSDGDWGGSMTAWGRGDGVDLWTHSDSWKCKRKQHLHKIYTVNMQVLCILALDQG